MSTSDYLLNAVLVLLVVRQIRGSKLDLMNLVLPLAITAVVAFEYLRSIPTQGNDLVLILGLTGVGIALGAAAAATTHLNLGKDGVPFAKAFSYASDHGMGASIGRFSVQHSITGSQAWVAALVLMALGEVVTRMAVLRLRGHRLTSGARRSTLTAA